MKGILPEMPSPAAMAAKFCSATPISKNRSGNFFENASERVDSVRSAQSTTTLGSRSPPATTPAPSPPRVAFCSTPVSNNFWFSFAAGFCGMHSSLRSQKQRDEEKEGDVGRHERDDERADIGAMRRDVRHCELFQD